MNLWLIGRGWFCLRYLCIMLYVKLLWCSGLPWVYGWLEEGWGQSIMKLIWCGGLPRIYGWFEGGSSARRSAKFGVVVFKASLLKRGGSICHRSMLHHYTSPAKQPYIHATPLHPISLSKYLCIMLYVKLMWCSGLPCIYGWLEEGVGSVCHENDSV